MEEIKSIDIFMGEVYNPSRRTLRNGLKPFLLYVNVPDDYLNGFINTIDEVLCAYMLRIMDYSDQRWDEMCENVNQLQHEFHTDISNKQKFTDTIILGKSGDDYVIFYSDTTGRGCEIGLLLHTRFENMAEPDEYVKEATLAWAKELVHLDNDEWFSQCIKKYPDESFNGWLKI